MDSGPVRWPFRVIAGGLALLAAFICGAALVAQFGPTPGGATDRLWIGLLAMIFGFSARWFGYYAVTGLAPRRPRPAAWRVVFDVLYGIGAMYVILVVIQVLLRLGGAGAGGLVLSITLSLAFMRAVRRYWERGAATARPRVSGR